MAYSEQPIATLPFMGHFISLFAIARWTSHNNVFWAIGTTARQGNYMIGMIIFTKRAIAVITASLLSLVLTPHIGTGVMTFGAARSFQTKLSPSAPNGAQFLPIVLRPLLRDRKRFFSKRWISAITFSKLLAPSLVMGIAIHFPPSPHSRQVAIPIFLVISLLAFAYALLVFFSITPIVLSFLGGITARFCAYLAVAFQSALCFFMKSKKLICGGFILMTTWTVFEGYRFWGKITHVISSLIASGRPGTLVASPGTFIGFYSFNYSTCEGELQCT